KIQTMQTKTITRQQVIDLVMNLPAERLISVYDFARFVQSHPLERMLAADIFGETEDEIRADEEQWDQQFAASRDELRIIAREAAAEYRAGRTKPMELTPEERRVR
ncbi:MAG: hypothetical protein ABIL11_03265, partial [Chloroflexota bacterium]